MDLYICKRGQELRYVGEREDEGRIYKTYRARGKVCKACDLREECMGKGCKGTGGKEIWVLKDKEFIERQREALEMNKELMVKRKTILEGIIGFIKSVIRFNRFSFKGFE